MYILPESVGLLEYKPEKPKPAKTALLIYKDYLQEKVKAGEISIFSLDRFPYTTNSYNFSPMDVYNAILEYSENTQGLETILKKAGIKSSSFKDLLEKYGEIRQIYERSFYRKAECYENLAAEQLTEEIPEDCWKVTKWGKELSYAGVRLLEHRFNGALRLAGIHNREIYGDRTQIDQRSLNLNVNTSIGNQANIAGITDKDLIHTLFTAYKK